MSAVIIVLYQILFTCSN